MTVFAWPVRVYYEDTDHGGVVYHANHLKFMERARTELFRKQGVELDHLQESDKIIFAVTQCEIDFVQPAKFNNLLLVTSEITEGNRIKIEFKQKVYLMEEQDQKAIDGCYMEEPVQNKLLVRAKISVVSLNADTLKPKRIPELLREELMREY